jgi:hypothetical protein
VYRRTYILVELLLVRVSVLRCLYEIYSFVWVLAADLVPVINAMWKEPIQTQYTWSSIVNLTSLHFFTKRNGTVDNKIPDQLLLLLALVCAASRVCSSDGSKALTLYVLCNPPSTSVISVYLGLGFQGYDSIHCFASCKNWTMWFYINIALTNIALTLA